MKKACLKNFMPTPHPVRDLIREHRIPIAAVAAYLDLAVNYTANLLNGRGRLTPDNERRLAEFAAMVEEEAVK
jgi:plasmid maintenance system antidote protein VapI